MEYPGYGLHPGSPSSELLLADALIVYDHLTSVLGVPPSDLLLVGRSIGASPACWLARYRSVGALVLMSPFKSIKELARDLVGWLLSQLIAERFRNIDLIKEVTCPVFIVHG